MIPRVYLITASTGIGAETARLLAGQGHRIFVVSRTTAHCDALTAELQRLGIDAASFTGDLAEPTVPAAAVARCVETFGRIDGLFNVAGISARRFGDGPLHLCSEEGWKKIMDTNLASQYRMSREAIRVMLDQEPRPDNGQRGVILNMASILGIHPEPHNFSALAYATAKGGIIAMTRASAAYYAAEKIRINAIAPALVHTPMSSRASEDPEILEFIAHKQPLTSGMIPVEDVASVSAFLLTDGSRSMTGEVVEVDGGWNLV
jgi:NAD(P)-dependent dehydrogenase (short-subunit alcohol dehydrogenase family)